MILFQIENERSFQALQKALEKALEEIRLEPTVRDDYLKHDPARFFLHPPVRPALLKAKPMTRPTHRPCCRSRLPSAGVIASCDDPMGH